MTIKAVFFDAAGTLIQPTRRVGESYSVVAKKYGIDVTPAEISERFRSCFDAAPPLAFPGATSGNLAALERDWWKQLVRHIFEPCGDFDRFDDCFTELFAYFARPEAWMLYPETLETLSALKDRRLFLGVISNFDSRLLTILDGLGAAHWFEDIFISSHVGYAKPARQIFETALARHGLNPTTTLHVGDSEDNDLRGANNAGMKGILIDRRTEYQTTLSPRVTSLKEIFYFLGD